MTVFENGYFFEIPDKWIAEHDKQVRNDSEQEAFEHGYDACRRDAFEELKSLLRCRNYPGCAAGKGCNGICSIDSDICRSCENFGIPYSLLAEKLPWLYFQKGAKE